jgi:hypothetical protein
MEVLPSPSTHVLADVREALKATPLQARKQRIPEDAEKKTSDLY